MLRAAPMRRLALKLETGRTPRTSNAITEQMDTGSCREETEPGADAESCADEETGLEAGNRTNTEDFKCDHGAESLHSPRLGSLDKPPLTTTCSSSYCCDAMLTWHLPVEALQDIGISSTQRVGQAEAWQLDSNRCSRNVSTVSDSKPTLHCPVNG
ncbi:uncharacterized protein LOC144785100 [Lissotriton helveticus]